MTLSITRNARPATFEVNAVNERGETVPTPIAGEHPLTLYLDKRELLTLMTLGGAPEALAIGWLRNQRMIQSLDELASVQVDWETHSVAVTSRYRAAHPADDAQDFWHHRDMEEKLSKKTVTTGCGQGTMFGDLMEDIDRVRLPASARLSEEVLFEVMNNVRRYESIYKVAGAVHGCALCSNAGTVGSGSRGEILSFVEDVGRHNAVDAIAGQMWLDGMDGSDKIFYTTGRLTSEMVIKCAQMGIPFLLSRSGLTQMGYEVAQRVGITMIGRCQGKHYLLFTGQDRFITQPRAAEALSA
jgi:FdhD protein